MIGLLDGSIGKQDSKLIASIAGTDIDCPGVFTDRLDNLDEHRVTEG